MAKLNRHPAPGFGDLLPGSFVVPQNPIAGQQAISYIPKIGELLPGRFTVPQNPLIKTVRQGVAAMTGLGGCGCSTGGGDEGAYINGSLLDGVGGLGDALGSVNWPTVIVAAGAAWLLLGAGKGGRS